MARSDVRFSTPHQNLLELCYSHCPCLRSSKSPINPNLHVNKKSNLQNQFGSEAMVRLYELLCHHSLANDDPLLGELLSYLLTRFSPRFFDHIAYESSDKESVRSNDCSVSAFCSDDLTYFSKNFSILLFLLFMQLQVFYHEDGHKT